MRSIQGGVIAMLADTAMAVAVQTTLPAGTAAAGLDLKVNYLRPALPDGHELRARGAVVHAGRTLVVTRAEIANADGKRLALATGSSMYVPNQPAALGERELAAEADDSNQPQQGLRPGRASHGMSGIAGAPSTTEFAWWCSVCCWP